MLGWARMVLSGQSHNSISFPARIIIVDSFMKIAMKHGPNDKLLNLTIWIASSDPMTMARLLLLAVFPANQ